MQPDWQKFLMDRGAEFENGLVAHYGNLQQELAVALSGNILCDLSHYALLEISGADARAFLHSQLINDIQSLDADQSQLNAYCNPKGRVIANFRVFRRDNQYYLRYPGELTHSLSKRLGMYIMRSKVELNDVSDEFARFGYAGATADKALAEVVDNIPETVNGVSMHEKLQIIRVQGITPSYELYGDAATLQGIWEKLDVHAAPIGAMAWDLIEVLAGIANIVEKTSEQFVPQMLNYQAIGSLSFTKGCYPGQEIVARMHYLGKLKKRLYLARVRSDQPPEVLQALFSDKSARGAKAGNIVNVARHPDGDYAVLAVIQISDADSAAIRLGQTDGPLLEIQELPYPVELRSK